MFSTLEKKFRLFRSWTSRHPIWCAWQVTYRCNFRCRFCHYWHDPLGRADEPSVANFETGARKLATYPRKERGGVASTLHPVFVLDTFTFIGLLTLLLADSMLRILRVLS